jgi:hypothetical protein
MKDTEDNEENKDRGAVGLKTKRRTRFTWILSSLNLSYLCCLL